MLLAASFLKGILILLTLAAIVLWLCWRALRKSKDSVDLLVRWGLTVGLLVAAWKIINPVASDGTGEDGIANDCHWTRQAADHVSGAAF